MRLILFISIISQFSCVTFYKKESLHKFQNNLSNFLFDLKNNSNIHLHRLYKEYQQASAKITILPITQDKITWHKNGDKTQSHCEPNDEGPKSNGRNKPTQSTIYLNPDRINSNHKSFKRGILIHELIHALDFSYGRYHKIGVIREKRAVFFQNLWIDSKGFKPLRRSYHKRFSTLEYQIAVQKQSVEKFVNHIFSQNDLPK